jgi:hypothetical protein
MRSPQTQIISKGTLMLNSSRVVALLAFSTVFSALVCAPAHAQKPALVQNIDEKGRNPYQQTIQFIPTSTTTGLTSCSGGLCEVAFKPVPAGYRLVVTQVTAIYTAASTGDVENIAFLASITSATSPTVGDIAILPSPTISAGLHSLSAAITFYVEPGLIPLLSMTNVQNSGSTVTVSITGYLVNLNE